MNTWDYWPNGVAGDRVSKTGGYSYHFKEGHYAPDNNSRIWSIDGNEPYPTVLYYDDSNALTRLDVYYNPQFDTVVRWSDGPDLVLEARNAGGGAEQWFRYVHGPGSDQPLAMEVYPVGAAPVPGTGKQYYYHADGEGSIRLLTDANAQIANQYSYDSYGARLTTVESVTQQYGWKGYEQLPGLPFYFARARLYDPSAGRFLAEDPLGFGGGDTNLYSFAWNNAKNWNDPSGKDPGAEEAQTDAIALPSVAPEIQVGKELECRFVQIAEAVAAAGIASQGGVITIGVDSAGNCGIYVLAEKGIIRYVGRSANLARRELEHKRSGFDFCKIISTDGTCGIRGAEQIAINLLKPDVNKIRAIAARNPNLAAYIEEAIKILGGQ